MTKVKMLKPYRVALNPRQNTTYGKGEVYDVDDEMLNNMIHDGAAELVEEKTKEKPKPSENKAVEKVKENKSDKTKGKK